VQNFLTRTDTVGAMLGVDGCIDKCIGVCGSVCKSRPIVEMRCECVIEFRSSRQTKFAAGG